jgi:uncharacterized iron-regulated membrane protein
MSFFHKLFHQPRKLWLRRALFQIHLWAGVLLSLYIVIIALTGSILVFRSELTRALLPKNFSAYAPDRVAPLATVLDRFRTAYPGARLENIQMPSLQAPRFLLSATDNHQYAYTLLADPVTADLRTKPRTWLDWTYDLHVNLLLGSAHGIQVNGIGALGLLLLTFTGLVLWWPGIRTWVRGLGIGFKHNWRRINYDAHNAIGFWTFLIVTWWALSGIYFAWYRQFASAVAMISPLQGMLSPVASTGPNLSPDRASLEQVLRAVHMASPNGRLFSLSDPFFSGTSVYALVDLRESGDFSHRDIITISTTDARILTIWHYGQNRTAGDWFLWAMHPLHFGTLWGMSIKILWALCGLALAVLAITGLLMYWNRFLRHQLRSAR